MSFIMRSIAYLSLNYKAYVWRGFNMLIMSAMYSFCHHLIFWSSLSILSFSTIMLTTKVSLIIYQFARISDNMIGTRRRFFWTFRNVHSCPKSIMPLNITIDPSLNTSDTFLSESCIPILSLNIDWLHSARLSL